MIILTPDIGLKELKLIPREDYMTYLTLQDDSNKTIQTFTIDNTIFAEWYYIVEFTTEDLLLENRYYNLVIYGEEGVESYRDRIFVTSQTNLQEFSPNIVDGANKYKSNNSNNDFLTYGE
jgi:hypothetical protein